MRKRKFQKFTFLYQYTLLILIKLDSYIFLLILMIFYSKLFFFMSGAFKLYQAYTLVQGFCNFTLIDFFYFYNNSIIIPIIHIQ